MHRQQQGEQLIRSTITLSALWISLCLALAVSIVAPNGVFPLDECSSLPKDQLANCRYQQENGFPRPLRHHPYLAGYPNDMFDEDGSWRASLDDALPGPQRIHIPYMNLSIALREGERAFANDNAKWMLGKVDSRCHTGSPDAVVFSKSVDQRAIINSYYYDESEPNDLFPDVYPRSFKIAIPENLDQELDDLRERLAYKTSVSRPNWGDPNRMRRHEIGFVEESKSIATETGIPRIITHSYRVNWINRKTDELEITATVTDILFPYKNGTIHLSALITTLDDTPPDPVPWQHLWRDIQFDDGPPDNRPTMASNGETEERISIGYYLASMIHCEGIDALPDDWAWPKDYPRHWWSLENWLR